MNLPKKRGRPKLNAEEKARRQSEKESAKKAARLHGPKKRVLNKKMAESQEDSNVKTKSYLLTPAGKCPVELYGHDKEAIAIWMSQAKNIKKAGLQHTVQSLTYWLRSYFDYFSEAYKIAAVHVKELADTFEIIDYEPHLRRIAETSHIRQNLETVEKYIETGEV